MKKNVKFICFVGYNESFNDENHAFGIFQHELIYDENKNYIVVRGCEFFEIYELNF